MPVPHSPRQDPQSVLAKPARACIGVATATDCILYMYRHKINTSCLVDPHTHSRGLGILTLR